MNWLTLFLHLIVGIGMIPAERVLVWEDNFDGNSLDEAVWALNTGNGCDQGDGLCGWGNNELQTYTEDNHQVQDGLLWITANKVDEAVDERFYTSSRVRSMPPVAFLTGRIESRIQVPAGLGLWAAFWMLPANTSRGFWAATGEIDIMESVNDMETILGTIHYGGEWPANRHAGCVSSQLGTGLDYSSDYHVYAVEWEQDEMRWYVDDQLFCQRTKWTSNVTSNEPYRAPFDAEFEVILNLAVGGALPGRVVDDAAFPATMLVDYVRVYDISTDVAEAEPFLGAPLCLPGTIQAEAFDTGGLGLGFGDSYPEGTSGTYRMDGIGLVYSELGRTFVANLTDTDWLAYTVMTEDAVYDITLEVSATEAADLELIIGDTGDDNITCANPGEGSLTGVFTVDATGAGSWGAAVVSEQAMTVGTYSLKLCVKGGVGVSVDSVRFDLVEGSEASSLTSAECTTSGQSRPYMYGDPWVIPGFIEAEYYDYGGNGVGFHKNSPEVFYGDSALRLPDAVGVYEAESNPSNGHYVGYWDTGEWLAFTARADESAFWDVGASVASGLNGTTVQFRVLVNATNCSSAATDGLDGLGDTGVDLLNGPLFAGYTGSWEAFEMVYKEEVYVPEGTHRFLFCADDGIFNMNFLRVWTPTPTPAPTMAPTVAPTPAPVAPSNDGGDTKWIYIGVAGAVVFLALSRLGCIIYGKERSRRRKPDDLAVAYTGSKDTDGGHAARGGGGKGFVYEGTPPSDSGRVGGGGGGEGAFLSLDGRPSNVETGNGRQSSAAVDPTNPTVVHQQSYRNLFSRRLSSSTSFNADTPNGTSTKPNTGAESQGASMPSRDNASATAAAAAFATTAPPLGAFRSAPGRPMGSSMTAVGRSASPPLPLVSPVESAVGVGASVDYSADPGDSSKTPRAKSGQELRRSGSLWDRPSTLSPILSKQGTSTATPSTPKGGNSTGGQLPEKRRSEARDQFEDALIRALDNKWESGRPIHGGYGSDSGRASPPLPPMVTTPSRSNSINEGPSAMLMAVKTWTCVCTFENSVGQTACLECGRVAPLNRPSTPSRKRLPKHRMNSSIAPPNQDDF